jgi:hypothetical protein
MRNQSLWVLGEVWYASLKLKGIDGTAHQKWNLRLNLTQHGETHERKTEKGLTD